jgi:hypothetical protein
VREAAAAEATMLYDVHTGRLKHLKTREEIELLKVMPTHFHGEGEPDGVDKEDAEEPTVPPPKAQQQKKKDKLTAAQRREVRRKKRLQLVLAQRAWRRRRLGQLANLSRRPGGLEAEERTELARLQAEQMRADEAERRGEEEKVADDAGSGTSSDDDEASEESTDSDAAMPPSAAVLRRRKRLAAMSPRSRVSYESERLSRAVVRSFTTRPLLQIYPLESGSRQQGRVWTNSVYYSFELAAGDAGVWVRLFAADAGSANDHLELMVACGAPPTRRNRFVTTATRDGSTHCAIDLRDGEMGRVAKQQQEEQRKRDEADGLHVHVFGGRVPSEIAHPPSALHGSSKGSSRWFVRVLGRGLRLKHFTLEFRIHTLPTSCGDDLARTLDDLELQAHWQDSLNDKALVVQHFAQETMRALRPREHADLPESEGDME